MRSHLAELLGARLGLPRAGARPEAGHEALEPVDLGLLALDRAPEGQLARGLLLAPGVPGAGEEPCRGRPRAPAPRYRRPPGTSGRGRPARQPRRARPGAARATPARRCRGGWSARRAAADRGLRPAPGASEPRVSSPPEKVDSERSRSRVDEAQPVQRRERAITPAVAAGVLEPRLGFGVAVERRSRRGRPRPSPARALRAAPRSPPAPRAPERT